MMQDVNASNLIGTRYLFAATVPLIVGLALLLRPLRHRLQYLIVVSAILAIAGAINFVPWYTASASAHSLQTQLTKQLPILPLHSLVKVGGLQGEYSGAFAWYARRSFPEMLYAVTHRDDLYAAAAFEPSVLCGSSLTSTLYQFSWSETSHSLTRNTDLASSDLLPTGHESVQVHVQSIGTGKYDVSWSPEQAAQEYRSIVLTTRGTSATQVHLAMATATGQTFQSVGLSIPAGVTNTLVQTCGLSPWVLTHRSSARFTFQPALQLDAVTFTEPR